MALSISTVTLCIRYSGYQEVLKGRNADQGNQCTDSFKLMHAFLLKGTIPQLVTLYYGVFLQRFRFSGNAILILFIVHVSSSSLFLRDDDTTLYFNNEEIIIRCIYHLTTP